MAAKDLSDDSLRKELLSLGQKVGPITDSTRALYTKKLNTLRNERGKVSKQNAVVAKKYRKLIGFSSDESEPESNRGAVELRTRRRRVGKPVSPQSDVQNLHKSKTFDVNSAQDSLVTRRTPSTTANHHPVQLQSTRTRSKDLTNKSSASTWRSGQLFPSRATPNPVSNDVDFDSSDSDTEGRKKTPSHRPNSLYTVGVPSKPTGMLNKTFTQRDARTTPPDTRFTPLPRSSTPLRDNSFISDRNVISDDSIDQSFTNNTPNSGLYKRRLEKLDAELRLQKEFKTEETVQRSYMTYVSWVIVFLTAAFFLLIGLLYLTGVKQGIVMFGTEEKIARLSGIVILIASYKVKNVRISSDQY